MKKKFSQAVNHPFVMDMPAGRYSWCTCGESKKQPFCDGSHTDTGMLPVTVIIEETKTIAWCGCKCSEKKPYCDGTHKKISA